MNKEESPSALTGVHDSRVQLIAATHSPLVLASAEPRFDAKRDAWFDLDLEDGRVVLRKRPFVRLGEVGNWLRSEAFDLKEERSLEAEEAISDALALAREESPKPAKVAQVDERLRQVLGDTDRFWVRWSEFRHSRGGATGSRRQK